MDSVLNIPVMGVRGFIGDSLVVSDSNGRFTVVHRAGDVALTVDDFRFDPYRGRIQLHSNLSNLQLRLRGNAPYLTACSFGTDLITATVIDLQGRKTVNRRSASTMTLVGQDGTSYRRDANTWSWSPVDFFTWQAYVPATGISADTADWRLEDADGHVRSARCVNQPAPCQDCSAPNEAAKRIARSEGK